VGALTGVMLHEKNYRPWILSNSSLLQKFQEMLLYEWKGREGGLMMYEMLDIMGAVEDDRQRLASRSAKKRKPTTAA